MDASNYTNNLKLSKNPIHKNKIHLFLYSTYPNENRQVPDPYFGGNDGFENVFQMLKKASLDWLNKWT
jgi:protein-tyrosine phosphatase